MSQCSLILSALRRGSLTKLEAFRLGGGLSLNSRVAELRAQGHDIRCERREVGGRAVYVYRLVGQLPLYNESCWD